MNRSHLWAVPGRTVLSGLGRPAGGLSPRLSTGSSSQQSDTSFDSEDSIVSVIAAKPSAASASSSIDSHRELRDSFDDRSEGAAQAKTPPAQSQNNTSCNHNKPRHHCTYDIIESRTSSDDVPQKQSTNSYVSQDTISPTDSSSSDGSGVVNHFLQSSVIEVDTRKSDLTTSNLGKFESDRIGDPSVNLPDSPDWNLCAVDDKMSSNCSFSSGDGGKQQKSDFQPSSSSLSSREESFPQGFCFEDQHEKLLTNGLDTTEPCKDDDKSGSGRDDDGSSRRNSISSDGTGEEDFTFHRYYHVFREGELDQLIETYVDNLHIISSYYDHANWCIIAEKVQVWRI